MSTEEIQKKLLLLEIKEYIHNKNPDSEVVKDLIKWLVDWQNRLIRSMLK